MDRRECSVKLERFLSVPSAHLFLVPAGILADCGSIANMPHPISLEDFEGVWKIAGYWDKNSKVIVQLEAHELERCARCVVPRGSEVDSSSANEPLENPSPNTQLPKATLPEISGGGTQGIEPRKPRILLLSAALMVLVAATATVLTRSHFFRKPVSLDVQKVCRGAAELLDPTATNTLSKAKHRLAELTDRGQLTECYSHLLRDSEADLPRVVFATRGLFEEGEWVRFFPLAVDGIVTSASRRLGGVEGIVGSYKKHPDAEAGAKLIAGQTVAGVAEAPLRAAREVDEWLKQLPVLNLPTAWKPPWLTSRTLTPQLARAALLWEYLGTCADFPGIPEGAEQQRPGASGSVIVRTWIAALLGGVMVGGLQPGSRDRASRLRLRLEHIADRQGLSLQEHIAFIRRETERAERARRRNGHLFGEDVEAPLATVWPVQEELPLGYIHPRDWCLTLGDIAMCRPEFEPKGEQDTCSRRGVGQADCIPVDGEDRGLCVYYHRVLNPYRQVGHAAEPVEL